MKRVWKARLSGTWPWLTIFHWGWYCFFWLARKYQPRDLISIQTAVKEHKTFLRAFAFTRCASDPFENLRSTLMTKTRALCKLFIEGQWCIFSFLSGWAPSLNQACFISYGCARQTLQIENICIWSEWTTWQGCHAEIGFIPVPFCLTWEELCK